MEFRGVDPEELPLRGQRLGQGEESVKRPETDQDETKSFSIAFLLDAFGCNEEYDPVRNVLQYSVFGDVTIGRGAQSNLGEKQRDKDQGWPVQGVFRQCDLPR